MSITEALPLFEQDVEGTVPQERTPQAEELFLMHPEYAAEVERREKTPEQLRQEADKILTPLWVVDRRTEPVQVEARDIWSQPALGFHIAEAAKARNK